MSIKASLSMKIDSQIRPAGFELAGNYLGVSITRDAHWHVRFIDLEEAKLFRDRLSSCIVEAERDQREEES